MFVESPGLLLPQNDFETVHAHLGDTVSLSCLGIGKPAPKVTLYRPRRPGMLSDAPEPPPLNTGSDTIFIRDVSYDDAGEYVCSVSSTLVNPPAGINHLTYQRRYNLVVGPRPSKWLTSCVFTCAVCSL